ncbi:HNH endonuclease [Candidatus Chloroploca sp. Khr17]|uniref:HNH endonuclease n=1 Tax=Candidatus Chloroploca sp. Khr17 TaxID=2496869 RepID=UPI00101DA335|nr:HNH endonuclease signature motif containing protein [Candidatus Chloroploca sp. Khr17]
MSKTYITQALRRLVESRAHGQCEYCLLPSELAFMLPHEVDHVIAVKHGGATHENNLALTCWRCNRYKGSDLTSFDPLTGALTPLFNPRLASWITHFGLVEARIEGKTAEGRTTIQLLRLNAPDRLVERQRLIMFGRFPMPSQD